LNWIRTPTRPDSCADRDLTPIEMLADGCLALAPLA
jgi:hypothetical protein